MADEDPWTVVDTLSGRLLVVNTGPAPNNDDARPIQKS